MNPASLRLRRSSLIAVLCAAAFLALQCIEMPLSPILPMYEIQLSIPIADFTRTLADMFGKDTSLVRQDGAGYFYQVTQTGQPTGISPLKVVPQPSGNQVTVGKIEVGGLAPTTVSMTAADLGIPSGTAPFPGGSTTVPPVAVGDTSLFAFAVVDTGSMRLSVSNTLPVAITFNQPVDIKNNLPGIDTSLIASFAIGTVAPGATFSQTVRIDGKFVWGLVRTGTLDVTFASSATPVTFDGSSGLHFTFGLSNLRVDSARALVPSQTVSTITDSVIVVDDSVSVSDAAFSSGSMVFQLQNHLGINVGVQLKLDNFRNNSTLQALQFDTTLAPGQTINLPVNLTQYDLINPTPDPIGTRAKFSVGIQTINSGGSKSTVGAWDFVRADFLPQTDFVLKSVTGRIKPTPISVFSSSSGVELGEASDKFKGNFTFDSVRIAVKFGLTGGFPVRYSLMLEARSKKTGITATLALPPPVGSTDTVFIPDANGQATIELGNSQGVSAFLSNFFPSFPDTFIVHGTAVVNPGFEQWTIWDTTKLYQSVQVYFPLKFGLRNGQLEDKIDIASGGKFPTDFVGDVKSSSLKFIITNRMPAALTLQARLLGPVTPSGRDTLLRIPSPDGVYTIAGATVDAFGTAISPQVSTVDFRLNEAQVAQFNASDTLFFRVAMATSGGNAPVQAVRFLPEDYITIRASGNLVYLVRKHDHQ